MSTELVELIDRYWDLAYAEGREGRTTDTPSGDANATRAAIADELTALTAKVALLTEALRPFARYCDELNGFLDNHDQPLPDGDGPGWVYVTIGDFRAARRALSEPDKDAT